jgi:hypothetical protein
MHCSGDARRGGGKRRSPVWCDLRLWIVALFLAASYHAVGGWTIKVGASTSLDLASAWGCAHLTSGVEVEAFSTGTRAPAASACSARCVAGQRGSNHDALRVACHSPGSLFAVNG